jgi:thioredoxin-related protein
MNAVTYSDENVIDFVQNNLIPLRIAFDTQPLASEFNLKWTPTIIILDSQGKEHQRTVGFLPPEEFIPSLLLGIAKSYFEQEKFPEALSTLDKIISEHSQSDYVPEAIYFRGVCGYKNTHNPMLLKEAFELLRTKYPKSEWTKRATPYSLL